MGDNDVDDQTGRLRAQVEVAHAEAVTCRLIITEALLAISKQDDEFRQTLLKSLASYGAPADVLASLIEKEARILVTDFADLFRR